ncbi:MAG TPA: cytochrome c biogenesis protein CcsA, partial [Woeseiaceae bacterium]|nr:cytochrome c biogenesis protein CcsA [Woeseiaceae bacterium]
LHAAQLSPVNQLFAPLEMTEKLLYGIAAAGFLTLLLAVFSGFLFVNNLFAQHLVHKTSLSLLALVLFGVLLGGRWFAGWRGRRAVFLYLWGFAVLGLAYFGSRFVLEQMLGRSWG